MGNARFVIFSRNRAMQLQALLESLYSNIVESKINSVAVIYKADPNFISSYNKLKENFGSIEWIEEADFRSQTIDAIKTDSEFTSFLVDDVLVHSKIQEDFFPAENDICFSLRLGKNCRYSHPANSFYSLPDFITDNGEKLRWNWSNSPFDFGYPFSLDGHVFRTSDLIEIISLLNFRNPNSLENEMVYRNPLINKFIGFSMSSFNNSKIVGIPVNRVNEEVLNRFGVDYRISEEELEENFKIGKRIAFDKMDFSNIIGPHQEIKYEFE
jgi:hypothetical protein